MKCHPAGALALTLVVAAAEHALSEGQLVDEVISAWPAAESQEAGARLMLGPFITGRFLSKHGKARESKAVLALLSKSH